MVIEIIKYTTAGLIFTLPMYIDGKIRFQNFDKYQNLLLVEKGNFMILRFLNNGL